MSTPDTLAPNFLVIGAMKAGTTSLHHYLRAHPQVQVSEPKETHFFSRRENWERGWPWYLAHFPERTADTVAVGEVCPTYSRYPDYPDVPERIASRLPHVKLVYLVRHPIERIRSQYQHRVLSGRESRAIEDAVLNDPAYVNPSRYAMQIAQYRAFFPKEQMLVLTSEALRDDRRSTLGRMFRFLGVDDAWWDPVLEQEKFRSSDRLGYRPVATRLLRPAWIRRLALKAPRRLRRLARQPLDESKMALTSELRSELERRLREDVRALRSYLGPGFDGWGLLQGTNT